MILDIQDENEAVDIKYDLDIINEYISIMKPLTYKNRFALQFENKPLRKIDYFVDQKIKNLAKKHQLHRKLRHAQSGIYITYDDMAPRSIQCENEVLKINLQYLNEHTTRKRCIILCILFIIIVLIYKFLMETR